MRIDGVGVVIGRFQVHELHPGHLALLNWVRERHARMLILVGVRPSPATLDHSLDFRTREAMLRLCFQDAVILPVVDEPNDSSWSGQVDRAVETAFPFSPATLYGGRDSFIPHYNGRYTTRALDLGSDLSASDIRKTLIEQPINSPDFRAGVIYATGNLPVRTYLAVDIALLSIKDERPMPGIGVRQGRIQVWLGRKAGETGYRLPGGHVDAADANTAAAAKRELFEETGLTAEGPLTYIGDFKVDDWRTRGVSDAYYRTVLYAALYSFGNAQAADDLQEGAWFDLFSLPEIVQEHRPLIAAVIQHLGRTLDFTEPTFASNRASN